MALAKGIFIVAARRTAFGAFGGKLKDHTATDLAEIAARSALAAGNISPETIDTVIFGNVIQSSSDAAYVARHVGLRVGVPVPTPALTVNRLCGSGFQAVICGAQDILMGDAQVALCGGTENMTQAPYALRDARFGTKFGTDLKLEDTLWSGLTDQHIKTPMGITAENLAELYKTTREESDRFAIQSQDRWHRANGAGVFKAEIAPITLKSKKGDEIFDTDEHPRQTSLEKLSKLPPVFKKNGTVNAGNASGVCDGAAAIIIASEEALAKNKWIPLARLVGYSVAGCDPKIMGIGPVPAIQSLLKKTGMTLADIDIFEVNEAFAPQSLAVIKELKLDPSRTNMNGGAIALGHPLGASGARITAHLTHELRRQNKRFAIGSACIGGGQGIALLLEKM